MERRYREVTLKRKECIKKMVLGTVAFFVLWGISLLRPLYAWEGIWETGTNFMRPAIFKYESLDKTSEDAPFFLWLTFPKIFAYTWQDSVPAFQVIGVHKEGEVQKENIVHKGNEIEKRVEVVLNQEKELSLLQENIYTPNLYIKNNELNFLQTENVISSIQAEGLTGWRELLVPKYNNMTELIKDYYIIDASTSPDSNLLDAEYMATYDCAISKETEGPQILIYHSHSQEGFADSIPGDVNTTIVGAGARLTALLEQKYGFQVLHHTGVYDVPSRDNAYGNALPVVEQILQENPSIQAVIDLHRDAVNEGTKLVKTIDGKDYARFMFFNGICRSTNGPITYLSNPYLKDNLAFSFQAQTVAENYFPGITRKIYLKAWRYNMHLRPRNMLIELGAQTNTVAEIMNTCDILAFVLNEVLSGQ